MRLRLERVPEEQHDIDLPLGDPGSELLVTSERPTLEPRHGKAELLVDQPSRRAGAVEIVPSEDGHVVPRSPEQIRLLVVVCDQRDPTSGQLFSLHTYRVTGERFREVNAR